jgi:hypothetical protein
MSTSPLPVYDPATDPFRRRSQRDSQRSPLANSPSAIRNEMRLDESHRRASNAFERKRDTVEGLQSRGVQGVSTTTSAYDLDKAVRQVDGTSLQPRTSGIDAFKRSNNITGPTSSVNPTRMQTAVSAAAKAFQSSRTPMPSTPAAPSTPDSRAFSIAQSLKPGESVGIKQGNTSAMGWKDNSGLARAETVVHANGNPVSKGPGMVRNDAGDWVPIAQETARIGAPIQRGIDQADRAATSMAATIQRQQDADPVLQTRKTVDAYQTQRNRDFSTGAPGTVTSTPTPAAPDPFRTQRQRRYI